MAAGTRVHGGDELEPRREDGRSTYPGDGNVPILERLPESLQGGPVELGQLVQEEDPVVCEGHFARRHTRATADHCGVGDGVVRSPERPPANQPANLSRAGHRGDDRGYTSLLVIQGWEQTRHGAGQEGLARARRADHDHAMPAGQCQLESPPPLELTANFGQIGTRILAGDPDLEHLGFVTHLGRHLHPRRPVASPTPAALPHNESCLRERRRRNHIYPARETRLVSALDGNQDPPHVAPGESCHHRQQTGDGTQLAAKGKLAEDGPPTVRPHLLGPDQNAQRHGQVQRGAALAHIRRCQVDGDPPGRVLVAAIPDGSPDPLASLLQGRVRQPDDGEAGQARCYVHLHPNRASVQSLKGGREK